MLQQVRERAEVGLLARQGALEAAEALFQPAHFLLAAVELDLAVIEHAQATAAALALVLRRIARGGVRPAASTAVTVALQVGLDLVQLLLAAAQIRELAVELARVALQRALAVGLVILCLGQLVAASPQRVGEQSHLGLAPLDLPRPLLGLAHLGAALAHARLGRGQLGCPHGEIALDGFQLRALVVDPGRRLSFTPGPDEAPVFGPGPMMVTWSPF